MPRAGRRNYYLTIAALPTVRERFLCCLPDCLQLDGRCGQRRSGRGWQGGFASPVAAGRRLGRQADPASPA